MCIPSSPAACINAVRGGARCSDPDMLTQTACELFVVLLLRFTDAGKSELLPKELLRSPIFKYGAVFLWEVQPNVFYSNRHTFKLYVLLAETPWLFTLSGTWHKSYKSDFNSLPVFPLLVSAAVVLRKTPVHVCYFSLSHSVFLTYSGAMYVCQRCSNPAFFTSHTHVNNKLYSLPWGKRLGIILLYLKPHETWQRNIGFLPFWI